jgi:methionyl-tRNA formyltransferase
VTAEAELTAEHWNGGRVKTVEPRSLHLRISHENNRPHSSSFNSAFPSNKIDNLAPCYILLPKYRGPSPIAWAILKGEKKTGVTVFRITDQPYAGPVLVQRETMIPSDEIWFELHYRLARVACDAIDAALKTLDQDAHFAGEPQDESQATWAPELAATDGYLCFDESAEAIALRCRATWPWPGALSRYVNKKGETENLKIVRARAGAASIQVPPGTITSGFKIATADGELEIQHLELSDRRVIPWQDFVKQRQVSPGDRFEPVAR